MATPDIRIDDRDPSIVYSPPGAWTLGGNARYEYLATSTTTYSSGAVASFVFDGNGVSVWGRIPNSTDGGPPRTMFTIDGQVRAIINPIQQAKTQYQQKLVQVYPLPTNTAHTLLITNLDANVSFTLDYIIVSPVPVPATAPLHSPTPAPTPSNQPSSSVPVPQPSTPKPSQSNSSNGPALRVIIGVVVPAFVFLLVATFLVWKWKSKSENTKFWTRWPSPISILRSRSLLASQLSPFSDVESSSPTQQRLPARKNLANAPVLGNQVTSPPPYEDPS